MDTHIAGRAIHALAALRDCNGNIAEAAAKLGISQNRLVGALAEAGPAFYEQLNDRTIIPSELGLRFASRVDVFPYVNW
jgi:DNA-binding transcriptional LysR family regulator